MQIEAGVAGVYAVLYANGQPIFIRHRRYDGHETSPALNAAPYRHGKAVQNHFGVLTHADAAQNGVSYASLPVRNDVIAVLPGLVLPQLRSKFNGADLRPIRLLREGCDQRAAILHAIQLHAVHTAIHANHARIHPVLIPLFHPVSSPF